MPTSASPVVAAFTRLNATQPLRPFVAYAQPTRLSFIQARRAASSAALYSRLAGPSPAHPPRAVSGAQGKAAVSLAARGLSASALTRAAAAPREAPAAAKDSVVPAGAADATSSVGSGERLLQPDASLALDQQSMGKLLTVWMVYQACGSTKLVQMAPKILKLFEKLRLSWLSNAVVRRTFFAWFCAGEKEREIVHTMRRLKESGIGSILDFSAEADLPEDATAASDLAEAARAHANVKADAFAKEYFHGMHMASQVPHAFAALKVTGLADPEVLYRLSMPHQPLRDAFLAADHDNDGRVDYTQFKDAVLPAMPGGARVASPSGMFSMIDANGDGQVDWVDIQMALGMDNPLARPLYLSDGGAYGALESDFEDYERMVARARAVVQQAAEKGVRVMIDAEHTYFQPMIDHVALVMQREFNAGASSQTLVYNTYQMYRTDALQRMTDDYERGVREGWRFAAKMVRGAYMELERERAASLGYASPINPTLEATHALYDRGAAQLLDRIAAAQREGAVPPALFVATHNNESIERVLQQLQTLQIDTSAEPVMFGQLLGMQDATSYALAKANIPIYKYVPYGTLDEVMPYLIRRAQENSAVAGAIRMEAAQVMTEIRRRMLGGRTRQAHSVASSATSSL
ncbi:proline dehydrogenase [Coemansia sp. RSA 720]|nr:proline dehydrogenase [Coemansia sp. RSA 720]